MAIDIDRLRQALAGQYEIDRELGSGGMATVFLAEDVKHHRKVAVKVLRPDLAAALGADRFLREIDIAAKLQHPHILPLHDSGQADGFLYYVMPYVEGESLRDRVSRDDRIPWQEAVRIAREVSSALDYAHRQGIVHRDIKPGNILISQGHAVVADFGIARALSGSEEANLTQIDFAIGTPAYMSPEQATSDPSIDGRSDIYALGCVLYEMLSGKPPYEGPTARAVIARGIADPVPKLDSGTVGRELPSNIKAAVRRALAKEPAERFQTARQMGDALSPLSNVASHPLRAAGVFMAGSALLFASVYFLTIQLGLPDWVFQSAAVVLIVGLPLVMLTSHLDRGSAGGVRAWLTWRRTISLGAATFTALGIAAAAYMGMRMLGIGPAAGLVASGVLEDRERIILTRFEDRTGDTLLAAAVTEAFRVDLEQSTVVNLLDHGDLAQTLALMRRPPDTPLDLELAREVAERAGIKAIVTGEINAVGPRLVLSARLVSAETDEVLAAGRETAGDSTQVIDAIDRLSATLRSRIGESLRSIRSNEPLGQVSTGSLEALRKYSQGVRALQVGDVGAGRALLQEAIALDTTFAMAYRKMGTAPLARAEQVAMLTKAFEYRDRLTDRERYLATGSYYTAVSGERDKAATAYRTLLEIYPDDVSALNNLGSINRQLRDNAAAEDLFLRGIAIDSMNPAPYMNIVPTQFAQGKTDEAQMSLDRFAERFPNHPNVIVLTTLILTARGEWDEAAHYLQQLADEPGRDIFSRTNISSLQGGTMLLRGRLAEAERHTLDAVRTATQIGIPGVALAPQLQAAIIDALFRDNPTGALARVENMLERYSLQDIDPLNRPYLALSQVYVFAGRTGLARDVLVEFQAAVDTNTRRIARPALEAIEGLIAIAEDRPAEAVPHFRAADDGECSICILPLLASAYDRAGERDSAVAVYERYITTPYLSRLLTDITFLASSYERLGQLLDQMGETERAVRYYDQFVALWNNADPILQPRVEAAKAAIARLSSEPSQ